MKQITEAMNRIRKYFLSGLVVFLPITLTIFLFIWAVTVSDGVLGKYLQPVFEKRFDFYVPGISIIVTVIIIIIVGFLVTNFLGQRIYSYFENLVIKFPFFRQVYPALKEMALFLFSRDRLSKFKQVVLIEYPRKGIFAIGFLTNESSQLLKDKVKKDIINVFIPSAPGPLTGFVILVPRNEVIFTDMTIEEAFKFILSGGVVNPLHV